MMKKKACIVKAGEKETMRGKYKKFTETEKETFVREYWKQESETGIKSRKYAQEHGIPETSFKRWIKEYPAVPCESDNAFILLSDGETVRTQIAGTGGQREIRLRYKDAVLEIGAEQLNEVMEILQIW